jgi:SAM-dependent methyltransferase
VLTGLGLAAGAWLADDPSASAESHAGMRLAATAGLALAVFALGVSIAGSRVGLTVDDVTPERGTRATRSPRLTLFLASFVALFVEMVLIRYAGSQIRIFAFYKNVPLISAFLGIGLGCSIGGTRPPRVLWLLAWTIPLAVFLAHAPFLLGGPLGRLAAMATSEHLLGDVVVVQTPTGLQAVGWQLGMGVVCVTTLVVLTLFFVPIGRLLGDAFERLPRLEAYTINIAGSLAGTGTFIVLGSLWAPPWAWFLVGLLPLLWWFEDRAQMALAGGLILLAAIAVVPSVGETIWSPYQKLVGHPVSFKLTPRGDELSGYLVEISDVFYQVAVDLRPEAVARAGANPFPHYDEALAGLGAPPKRVLVVGAGSGNDVAAALRAGADHVDAVDIDPAIVSLGRAHHPERPYDDPRVRVVVDDARAAFRHLPPHTYDAILFGLLDSHTQLGISSVRLDNYVFTRESLAEARRLLVPGGSIVLTAATFREWFRQRFQDLLTATCDTPVVIQSRAYWVTYRCRVENPDAALTGVALDRTLPTDDWPFLYLPVRGVPAGYLLVVGLLAIGSIGLLRAHGLSTRGFTAYHGHLFFLGAAFLLMEVYAINRLALLFGTTWIVSAVAIVTVLTLIVAANLTVGAAGQIPYGLAYAGLAASLLFSFAIDPQDVLGRGLGLAVAYALLVLLPVYFAGLVFARSFARAPAAGPAMGANMLGSVVGGWSEYATMAVGIRRLALMALVFYLGSLVCLVRAKE